MVSLGISPPLENLSPHMPSPPQPFHAVVFYPQSVSYSKIPLSSGEEKRGYIYGYEY